LFCSCLWSGDASVVPPIPIKPSTTETNSPPKKESLVLQPVLITVDAGQGGIISFKESEPSKLLGGVRIGYEHVLMTCDHVDYWQSLLPGVKRATLDHALFDQGPDSSEPGKVVFDSRATKLAQIGFRGLLQPAQLEIIRQPLNPDDKLHVTYRVLMHQVGAFSGDLETTDGWAPHAGWAEEAQLMVLADILPGGIANPRFTEVILSGRPANHPEGKRGARLERLKQVVADPNAAKNLGAESFDWWLESSRLTIIFDDQGRVQSVQTSTDTTSGGTPSLDTPVQEKATVPAVLETGSPAP
jgi:hypothetical protein